MTNDYGNLELHKVLLSAMKDIDKICRENGLRYYIYAGTLLGAVNYKGFIPWDDDADIVLFKDEYDKLIKIIDKEYSDIYFVETFDTDADHYSKMSKLRIKGTLLKSTSGDSKPIFLDISPLYNVPDNIFIRLVQRKVIEYLNMVLSVKSGDLICESCLTKILLRPMSRLPKKVLGYIQSIVMEKMGNRNSKYVGIMCNTITRNPYTNINGYENDMTIRSGHVNYIYIPFEDTEFMTISNWHDDLLRRYGPHYMDPYPEEKRITKHDIKEYIISEEVRKRVGI